MKTGSPKLLLLGSVGIPNATLAAARPDAAFQYKDLQLACDNTGTCRAAGYHADGEEPAVSLVLERCAGPRQEVSVQSNSAPMARMTLIG